MSGVIVTGGRDFSDVDLVDDVLNQIHRTSPITVIVTGGARGADRLAEEWAMRRMPRVHVRKYEADWKTHGRAAGPIRNQRMIDEEEERDDDGAVSVVAFPGGRGTEDCVRRAKAAGLVVCRASRIGNTINITREA